MPRSRHPQRDSIPPTMQPHQAIPLIREQINQLAIIEGLRYDDPQVAAWESTTKALLNAVFGEPNDRTHAIIFADISPLVSRSEAEIQRNHVRRQRKRAALLEEYIRQLQILAPPAAASPAYEYRFHSDIEKVSGQLYRDGHHKSAALEAYTCVINAVKAKSGIDDDRPDSLMNKAFGFEEGRPPVIQFNSLKSTEEDDEQKGFMFLYKGIVGLRNSKAHSNRLINDPNRAHEYLALASLLRGVLDFATVNKGRP